METITIPVSFYLELIGEYVAKTRLLELEKQELIAKYQEEERQRLHEENTAKRMKTDVEES